MIKASVAQHIGTVIKKSNQSAVHADGITPLVKVGETHIMFRPDMTEKLLTGTLSLNTTNILCYLETTLS